MSHGDASREESKGLEERDESDLLIQAKTVDGKLDRLETLDRHRLRSRLTIGALAVPPLGLAVVALLHGNFTMVLQFVMMAVLLFGVAWFTGRSHQRFVRKLEDDVDKLSGPSP